MRPAARTRWSRVKAGCVAGPLFSAFGPDPIVARLTKARARVLVTTASLYERKVAPRPAAS